MEKTMASEMDTGFMQGLQGCQIWGLLKLSSHLRLENSGFRGLRVQGLGFQLYAMHMYVIM